MSRKIVIARGLLIGALAAYIFVPTVRAGSVKATLYTNQTREATNPLHRDTKDEFLLTGGVLSTSKHEVRFYYGNCPESWNNNVDENKFRLECERVYRIDIGKTKNLIITKKMCDGDYCKVVMYGQSKEEPKKQCYANAVLSNY